MTPETERTPLAQGFANTCSKVALRSLHNEGWRRLPRGVIKALAIAAIVVTLSFPWALRTWVHSRVQALVYSDVQSAPPMDAAVVLGAGLWSDGSPTPVLYDRVVTAVDLYQAGRVRTLLMSGDNPSRWYNEPEAMRQLALRLGVPDRAIILDYAGRRTYDSCDRAHAVFHIQRAVIVTQRFHVDRALYLCQALGIEAAGVVADRRVYPTPYRQWWQLRELVALVGAWLEINWMHLRSLLAR